MTVLPDGDVQEKLRSFANPRWGYRRGLDGEIEKDLFDGFLPSGWADSPAKVDSPLVAATPGPNRSPPAPEVPPGDTVEDMSIAELNRELKALTGKGARPGTSKTEILELLEQARDNATI